MERHSIFVGQKTQLFQDISYSPLDLQIQCYWEEFSACHFVDINTVILSFIQKGKEPRMGNTIPKENKIGNLHCSTSSTFVVLSGLTLLRISVRYLFSSTYFHVLSFPELPIQTSLSLGMDQCFPLFPFIKMNLLVFPDKMH